MSDFFRRIDAAAVFDAEKPGKADLFAGRQLFVGLNCFEQGQAQRERRPLPDGARDRDATSHRLGNSRHGPQRGDDVEQAQDV